MKIETTTGVINEESQNAIEDITGVKGDGNELHEDTSNDSSSEASPAHMEASAVQTEEQRRQKEERQAREAAEKERREHRNMIATIEHKDLQRQQAAEIAGEQRAREEDEMFYDTMKQDKGEAQTTYDISSEATQAGSQPHTQQSNAPKDGDHADQDMDIDQDLEVWIEILEMDAME